MKKIIGLVIIASLVLVGCGGDKVVGQQNPPKTNTPFEEPTGELANKTWISPGVVEIGNFESGNEAEWILKIHNGNKIPTAFTVTYRIPGNTSEGFSMPPSSAQIWVTISETTPLIAAGETKDILVNLKVPSGARNIQPKWEFWVSVVEKSDAMIQTELCSRWRITMK